MQFTTEELEKYISTKHKHYDNIKIICSTRYNRNDGIECFVDYFISINKIRYSLQIMITDNDVYDFLLKLRNEKLNKIKERICLK